jgi:hypothetical protein
VSADVDRDRASGDERNPNAAFATRLGRSTSEIARIVTTSAIVTCPITVSACGPVRRASVIIVRTAAAEPEPRITA